MATTYKGIEKVPNKLMAKVSSSGVLLVRPKKKRPGVHAKSKTSSNSRSQRYKKPSVGQG